MAWNPIGLQVAEVMMSSLQMPQCEIPQGQVSWCDDNVPSTFIRPDLQSST